MKDNENRKYLLRVREELEQYYNGFINEEDEEQGLYDYLSDILDFSISIDSQMRYQSCQSSREKRHIMSAPG